MADSNNEEERFPLVTDLDASARGKTPEAEVPKVPAADSPAAMQERLSGREAPRDESVASSEYVTDSSRDDPRHDAASDRERKMPSGRAALACL